MIFLLVSLPLLLMSQYSIWYAGLGQSIPTIKLQDVSIKYPALHGIVGYSYRPFTYAAHKFSFTISIGAQINETSIKLTGYFFSPSEQDTTYLISLKDTSYRKSKFSLTYFSVPLFFTAGYLVGNSPLEISLGIAYSRLLQSKQKIVYSARNKIKFYDIKRLNDDLFLICSSISWKFVSLSVSWNVIPVFNMSSSLPSHFINLELIIRGYKPPSSFHLYQKKLPEKNT